MTDDNVTKAVDALRGAIACLNSAQDFLDGEGLEDEDAQLRYILTDVRVLISDLEELSE